MTTRFRVSTRAAILLIGLESLTPAFAQQPASVTAQNAWSRATPPGASAGAVYLTLTSTTGDKLTAASSPVAGKTEVHEMRMEGDIMRMRALEGGLDLPAGKSVTLQPGGYHVMLEQLKAPLKQGQAVPVHLIFQKAPPIDIVASVQAVGAAGPGAAGPRAMVPDTMPGLPMGK